MKFTTLSLVFILVFANLFAQKDMIVKFCFTNDSTTQFNINDIQNIKLTTVSSGMEMIVYHDQSQQSIFPAGEIDSIKFRTEGSDNFLNIYSGALNDGFNVNKIDSIIFKVNSGSSPHIQSIEPVAQSVGNAILINGTNFGNEMNSSTIHFNDIQASIILKWSATQLKVSIPLEASSGKVFITVNGQKSNEFDYSIIPTIESVNPVAGVPGDEITIIGTGFGITRGSALVNFNDLPANIYSSWSPTKIVLKVPDGVKTGKISVLSGAQKSNSLDFTVLLHIGALNPQSGFIGDEVTVFGGGFGNDRSNNYLTFNGKNAIVYNKWTDDEIKARVPQGASTGMVYITIDSKKSNEMKFIVKPYINDASSTSIYPGQEIILSGYSFRSLRDTNKVYFNGIPAIEYTAWTDNEIKVKVPKGAAGGKLFVNVDGFNSNELDYLIIPHINSLDPQSGIEGTTVSIYGSGFKPQRDTNKVYCSGKDISGTAVWSDTLIKARVPDGINKAGFWVVIDGQKSNTQNFELLPNITEIDPPEAKIGAAIKIKGKHFGVAENYATHKVLFNDVASASYYYSWTDTEINVRVPEGAFSGKVNVKIENALSNDYPFTVINDQPSQNEVTIGNQVWTKKNLDVVQYRNGDPIPQVTDQTQWESLTTGAWCYYNNDPATGDTYGKLYNWYAVNDPRGLAPQGWHVPTDAEWISMENYLGGASVAGGKLKEDGTSHWADPNTNATNETGFYALPGGTRSISFRSIGTEGWWWSSTTYGSSAWVRSINNASGSIFTLGASKNNACSVRLVKD